MDWSAHFKILAYVSQVHKVLLPDGVIDYDTVTVDQIERNIVRCPNPEYAQKMIDAIDNVRVKGDSVGVVTCIARNVPRGLGSVYDPLEADFGKAMLSLPAAKGVGYCGSLMTVSERNDEFYTDDNGSGGIQEGISNGETIYMMVCFKPTSTIRKKQNTVTRNGEEIKLIARGRHDPCVLPRAVTTGGSNGCFGSCRPANGSKCSVKKCDLSIVRN